MEGSYTTISKPLGSSDEDALLQLMNRYLTNYSQPFLEVGPEYEKVQFCFQKMRELITKQNNVAASQVTVVTHSSPSQTDDYTPNTEITSKKGQSKTCLVM